MTGSILRTALVAFALLASPALAQGGGPFRLAPQRPGVVDAYVLSFGLWGPQSVFESEAKGAARVLEAQLDARGRSVVRFNGKRRFGAGPEDLAAAARAVGATLDPDEDVAVVVLTSHGTPEGIGLVRGRDQRLVTPDDVRALLAAAGARHRVLIVSACYSGVFADALADPRTLVITAAAADRPSFGCRDGAAWTYFGDAFFNRALRREPRLDAAFATARTLVTERERREGFAPSNPQIAGGAEVLARLGSRRGARALPDPREPAPQARPVGAEIVAADPAARVEREGRAARARGEDLRVHGVGEAEEARADEEAVPPLRGGQAHGAGLRQRGLREQGAQALRRDGEHGRHEVGPGRGAEAVRAGEGVVRRPAAPQRREIRRAEIRRPEDERPGSFEQPCRQADAGADRPGGPTLAASLRRHPRLPASPRDRRV